MKNSITVVLCCMFGLAVSAAATELSAPYTFGNVRIVAGGFIPGILFHPAEPGLAYLRTDMGGAYRLNPATRTWEPITDHFDGDDWNMYGVESIALDPTDPNRIVLALGTYAFYDWAGTAAVIRSTDRGKTWQRTDLPFKLGANEDGRGMGERMAVDPNAPRILYLGTRKDGLWKSTDHGVSWNSVAGFPKVATDRHMGLGVVLIDPDSGAADTPSQTLYVGAARLDGPNFFRSIDGGETWSAVPGAPEGLMPYQGEWGENGLLYMTWNDGGGPNGITAGGVWTFSPSDGQWTRVLSSEGSQGGFGGLAVDPSNPRIVMTATIDRWSPHDEIYRSVDGGATWKVVSDNETRDASASPYLRWGKPDDSELTTGNWVSALAIDPFDPDRVLYATGATVWGTDNITDAEKGGTVAWVVRALGVEETSVLDLAGLPSGPRLFSGMRDICGFVHADLAVSPGAGMIDAGIKDGVSIDYAGLAPDILVIIGHDYEPKALGCISTDAGKTWSRFPTVPPDIRDGTIAVSADGSALVWAPEKAVPFRSPDRGRRWQEVRGIPGPARIVSDRVNAGAFYAVSGDTLYRSTDTGETFSAAAAGLRGKKLEAVPGIEGHLWIPGDSGLYHSSNGGESVDTVAGVDRADAVGFGRAAPGADYPAVFISGTVGGTRGVFRSDNRGANWIRVNDAGHQWGWIGQSIAGDPRVYGRFYLATNGRGIIRGDIAKP